MAMPTYQEIMLPFLRTIRDGGKYPIRAITDKMIEFFELSIEERTQGDSNRQRRIHNRTSWASTYLSKAGLIYRPQSGYVAITEKGRVLLSKNPGFISNKLLMDYPSFAKWQAELRQNTRAKISKNNEETEEFVAQSQGQGPVEIMDANASLLRKQLAENMLDTILNHSPDSFEKTVLDLMHAMGYGRLGTGRVTGGSGDGGIDGIINEDKLGLDKIYFQAKRYNLNRSVSASEVRDFLGGLDKGKVTKGVFVTTSTFSKDAQATAIQSTNFRVLLIDGQQLAELMIDHDVGVSTQATWTHKRIDGDYFNPEF